MVNLTQASRQLFRRSTDERFESLPELMQHCLQLREQSRERWFPPTELRPLVDEGSLRLDVGNDGAFLMNDWSFTQLCQLARVNKETVNRLTPATSAQVFRETLPEARKPMQVLTRSGQVRSLHGTAYTRLWNADLLEVIQDFDDFTPPQPGQNGGTGLYAGEQDCFAFLIDPTGWVEIEGQAFAPGFFAWNSEVGKRSVGLSTFWFQAVCANHIVWDCVDVQEIKRKHTGQMQHTLTDIRESLENLVQKRDARKDGFHALMRKAMQTSLGEDADEAGKVLAKQGLSRNLIQSALEIAQERGRFTIFSLVDALTRLSQQVRYAGDRLALDQKAATLLNLTL